MAALPRPNLSTTDELYEISEFTNPTPQRQQRQQPLSQPSQPRPSSSSGSTHILRRTPRLEPRSRTPIVAAEQKGQNSAVPLYIRDWPYSQSVEGSATPASSTQSLLSPYWPKRTTRISKHTANAIRYALEAVRADPEGSHPLIEGDKRPRWIPKPFTPDNVELAASMSDSAAGVSNGRTQNGGSRAAVPVPFAGGDRVRTPTDIMRERRDREARRKAESERRQREQDEEEQRRVQEEQQLEQDKLAATAGVAQSVEGPSYRRAGKARRSTGEATAQGTNERRPGERGSGGITTANISSIAQPKVYEPSNGRVEKPSVVAPDEGASSVPQPKTRPREATTSTLTGQPRPVEAKSRQTPRAFSGPAAVPSGQREHKTASVNATAATSQPRLDRGAAPPGQSQPAQDSTGSSQQRSTTSSFPHAFERWETLSSHWEGLTSFWIRRLEQNKDDLDREPLNQQMARQVTDLSAAGANLFHAVVELQRLRASSERKFQRWFFETRAEQERFRENQSKFEQRIQEERSAATNAHADLSRVQKERDAAISQRKTAEILVREKNRELSIAKEEARRAWEELGRREQEERDRTLSLKKGLATSVGGVHVVPMVQGASANRPATREGPGAGPNLTQAAHLESPSDDEPGYTTYDAARSETDTDPFTEGGRASLPQNVRTEADRSLLSNATSQPYQQTSNTSTATVQATRTATSSGPQQSNAPTRTTPASSAITGGTYLNYRPEGSAPTTTQSGSSSFYQHEGTSLHGPEFASLQGQPRVSEGDEHSYVPSVGDTLSEEDYDLDENGEIQRDAHGHPILGRRGPGSEDSDEYDVQEQLDRERMYGRSYGSGIAGIEYGSGPPAAPGRQESSAPDYSGTGFGTGWEALPRHHHPTRLSDVLEEDERSRATPSRASQNSRSMR